MMYHCDLPGCLEAIVEIPGGLGEVEVTIDYTYDSLYRLTEADYDDGTFFHYTYDAVGNRLTEGTNEGISTYTYDIANRLTDVDGVAYTWDANGNLLADGTSTYTYDAANRLVGLAQGEDTYAYTYNGLGDRLSQTVNGDTINYTLDTATYLTEVLQDGTSTYLYGLGRIGEDRGATTLYHLPDALGSVRQMVNSESQILFAQSYEPFGDVLETYGTDGSTYGFTGQMVDESGLVYLRARYYNTGTGRFFTKDPWNGSPTQPMSYDPYLYAYNNPIIYTDPSGRNGIIDAVENMGRGLRIHWMIQAQYMYMHPNAIVIPEFPIYNGSKKPIRTISAIRNNPNNLTAEQLWNLYQASTFGYADIVNFTERGLYEIKPYQWADVGAFEAAWYLAAHNSNLELPQLMFGTRYPIFPGTIVGTDPSDDSRWVTAWLDKAGVIAYSTQKKENNSNRPVPVYVFEWDPVNREVKRRKWSLAIDGVGAYQPAYSQVIDMSRDCNPVVIIGGTVIITILVLNGVPGDEVVFLTIVGAAVK